MTRPSTDRRPMLRVESIWLQPGHVITVVSTARVRFTVTNSSIQTGVLKIADGGDSTKNVVPPLGVVSFTILAGTIVLANIGPVPLLLDVGQATESAPGPSSEAGLGAFYILPGWCLRFDLPDGGSMSVVNNSPEEGDITVTQGGEADQRQIPSGGGTRLDLKPGSTSVFNSGKVRLLLSIEPGGE